MIHDVHSRDAIIISTERESVVIMVQNVPSTRDAICNNGTYENGMCGKYAFPKKEGGDDDGTCAVEGCNNNNFHSGVCGTRTTHISNSCFTCSKRR